MTKSARLRLPDSISTSEQLISFIESLSDYQSYIRRLNIAAKAKVDSAKSPVLEAPAMPAELLEFLKAQFGDEPVTIDRLEEIKGFFRDIKEKSPSVHIMMAFLPTASEKAQLTHWFRENIAADILLSFSQNSGMIGGMLIRTRTRIFDFSMRTTLMANRHYLAELLK